MEGMSYDDIAKHIDGATKVTIWRFLNPGKMDEHRESTKRRQRRINKRIRFLRQMILVGVVIFGHGLRFSQR